MTSGDNKTCTIGKESAKETEQANTKDKSCLLLLISRPIVLSLGLNPSKHVLICGNSVSQCLL